MKRLFIGIVLAAAIVGCGQSYEETKRITKAQRQKLAREDSAAFKVAVMPTLDCLPIFLARDHQLFDTAVDIRLKQFSAQMDVDTALMNGRVELGVTDLVRAEWMMKQGAGIGYLTATDAYWQLVTNRMARITDLKHLDDKMIAMTRHSATDLLSDLIVDSAGLKSERVFRIQINDVGVRLKMLENNEMDALLMTEPHAAQARLQKHKVLLDTRSLDIRLGAIVKQKKDSADAQRQRQLAAFVKGYNAGCDSLNKYGVARYGDLVAKYCGVKPEVADTIGKHVKFSHVATPRSVDIERAQKWLKKQ